MSVKKEIIDFFSENFMVEFEDDFDDDKSFLENGIIDSTGVLELVSFLEGEFGITVDDEDIVPENFQTITCLVDFVKTKLDALKSGIQVLKSLTGIENMIMTVTGESMQGYGHLGVDVKAVDSGTFSKCED